ncbi:PUA domain-containing protein [Caldivirga sp.]|uniref:PUA domain-containing protein n=1 Tax=Caldivirga sp. TaxID=2080243 RepID=UPI003D0AA057
MPKHNTEGSVKFIEVAKGIELDQEVYKHLLQYMDDGELGSYFESVRKPPRRYYVRVNTLKVSTDELLGRLKERGITAYRDEILEEAVWFPTEGPSRIGTSRKYVIADKYASESVYLGSNLYGPGVLYMPGDVHAGDEVNVISPNGDIVALGIAKVNASDFKRGFRGIVVETTESVYRLPKLRDLDEWRFGLFYEQSLPAQWVGRLIDPKPGEVIIDLCSAPGGKATHVAQLSGNRAIIIAVDRSWSKVRQVEGNAARLGVRLVTYIEDSRFLHVNHPELINNADKVLIDPPCSDAGVRPKLYYRLTMADLINLVSYQRQFIKVAYSLLKPNGSLVYSTCTLPPMENEDNVKWASELGFRLEHINAPAGQKAFDGASRRFHPHIQDTPGFFIAKLTKPS